MAPAAGVSVAYYKSGFHWIRAHGNQGIAGDVLTTVIAILYN